MDHLSENSTLTTGSTGQDGALLAENLGKPSL